MTTTLSKIGGVPGVGSGEAARRPVRAPSIEALLLRLRDAAGRLVAFSETKLLLREAASAIERLDRDSGRQAAETTRLTAELARERACTRSH